MIDGKNNTFAITPKRSVPKIEERNLSEQLQSIFPDVDEIITKESETFREKIEDSDTIIEKVTDELMIRTNKKVFHWRI